MRLMCTFLFQTLFKMDGFTLDTENIRQKGVCIYFRPALLFRSLFVHKALQSHVVWLVIGRVSSSGVYGVQLYRFPARAGCLSCQSNAENSGMSPAVHADSHAALNTKQAARVTTATAKSTSPFHLGP